MNFINIKSFDRFNKDNRILESESTGSNKINSYRGIAYKLSEIFALYGFFLAQKEGFFDSKSWPTLMNQIIKIKDPNQKWAEIIKLSKTLQEKTASSGLKASPGEFGHRGSYDYGKETEDLPKATEFLRAASNAAFKKFSADDQKKSMELLDGILSKMQPLKMSRETPVNEAKNSRYPTQMDLIMAADSTGSKLMNMYNTMVNLKMAYPESSSEIDSFIDTSIISNLDKVKSFIEIEIPKVKGAASVGFLKKLQNFDNSVDSLLPRMNEVKRKVVNEYSPIAAAKEFENSAMKIITDVRQSILKQAEINARWTKSGDVIAGTTDISDPKFSKDAQTKTTSSTKGASTTNQASPAKKVQQRKVDDLSDFLSKKYSVK